MKQAAFAAARGADWVRLEIWLDQRRQRRKRALPDDPALAFPAAYRGVCHDLALARERGYSHDLVDRLQALVERGHRVLYRPPPPRWQHAAEFVVAGFPRLVRAQWRCMTAAAVLLYLPAALLIIWLQWHPEFAHTLFSGAQLQKFERMYDPANPRLGRDGGTNLAMFGYYVMHNVGIAFRTFAGGLAFGIGAVYVLIGNGVLLGGIGGHLTAIGYGGPFWRFVSVHSGFELTAIVIVGGAGLQLGLALLAPGRARRSAALVAAGWIGAKLALGAFCMLVLAACIEAYWSSIGSLPDALRFASAALVWSGVGAWLGFGGRGRRHAA